MKTEEKEKNCIEKPVTRRRLEVLIAKYIKRYCRKFNRQGEIKIEIKTSNNDTSFFVDDIWLNVKDSVNVMGVLFNSLAETGLNGVAYHGENSYYIIVYAKPCEEFIQLTRLIYRYAGIVILWDDIRTMNQEKPELTKYLCYDRLKCLDGIVFFENNRSPKDIVHCEVNQVITMNEYSRTLTLSIADRVLKEKARIEIVV